MNTNENVTVVLNGNFGSREMVDMITGIAQNVLAGDRMPAEFDDVITMTVMVRPSGSKYVVVAFA